MKKITWEPFLNLTALIPQPQWRDVNDVERSSQNLWFFWLGHDPTLWSVTFLLVLDNTWEQLEKHQLMAISVQTYLSSHPCSSSLCVNHSLPTWSTSDWKTGKVLWSQIKMNNAAWYICQICPTMNNLKLESVDLCWSWKCQCVFELLSEATLGVVFFLVSIHLKRGR